MDCSQSSCARMGTHFGARASAPDPTLCSFLVLHSLASTGAPRLAQQAPCGTFHSGRASGRCGICGAELQTLESYRPRVVPAEERDSRQLHATVHWRYCVLDSK